MAEDDWTVSANQPVFSLFKSSTPEEEAKKDSFVDIIVYNRWSKAERRRYQRLKAEAIARLVETEKIQSIDEISDCMNHLNLFKNDSTNEECDSRIDDLINKLENMKVKASSTKPFKMMH